MSRWSLLVPLLALACSPAASVAARVPEPKEPAVEYARAEAILTSLPIRVWIPARFRAERVFALYQPWGKHDWSSVELERQGQMWWGEVSCREVSTVTGDMRTFFLAVDAEEKQVPLGRTSDWPSAKIVYSLPERERALSGLPPPSRCYDPADCPADFPGCPAYEAKRAVCAESSDCEEGETCEWDGFCSGKRTPRAAGSDDAELARAVKAALARAPRKGSSL